MVWFQNLNRIHETVGCFPGLHVTEGLAFNPPLLFFIIIRCLDWGNIIFLIRKFGTKEKGLFWGDEQ